ncbi:MAG: ribosome small subunit-dependent GTPase A [Planctomycetes bacterium]|nr:ribosome small subunit-dependent GTPase A [Planctomycetota bacterium]
MAKGKGKSQRRFQDWRGRSQREHQPAAHQKFAPRAVKIPAWRVAGADNLDDLPRLEGMVVGLFPGGAIVRAAGRELLCGVAGTFRAPQASTALVVGDSVTVAHCPASEGEAEQDDSCRADGMILARAERRTALCRPMLRSGKRTDKYQTESFEKVIAANMDVLLIVASTCQPRFRQFLIDRFLIVAQRGGLRPVLAVTKIDLAPPDEDALGEFESLVRAFRCCPPTGEGIGPLLAEIAGATCVLTGASGVGKSALVNAMVPGAAAATRQIRAKDERGRHTTTSASVYDLPDGGLIVDTPGVRELGVGLRREELAWYFPEFEPFAGQCKFADCSHSHEPDCAVIRAAESGAVNQRRYESYLRILQSVEG